MDFLPTLLAVAMFRHECYFSHATKFYFVYVNEYFEEGWGVMILNLFKVVHFLKSKRFLKAFSPM